MWKAKSVPRKLNTGKKTRTIDKILNTRSMKKLLYALLICTTAIPASAQLSITASDMPVSGDTLRWSAVIASPTTNITTYSQTGSSHTWNFSGLTPVVQGIDAYKPAISVSPLYFSISATAYGYKVADSLPVPNLPISVKELYTFYGKKTGPSRFVAEGFGAKVSGLPVPAAYSDEDELYFFPLTYNRFDSSAYKLDVNVAGAGRLVQQGIRLTKVDGEGTIQTPYTTAPVACIRVRTEVIGVDSLIASGLAFPLPRHTVEYKWLAKTEHYPLLWVTTNVDNSNQQTLTDVRYRDVARSSLKVDVSNIAPQSLEVFVEKASHTINLFLPAGWEQNTVEMFDVNGRRVVTIRNAKQVDGSSLAAGTYLLRVTTTKGVGYAKAVL